MAGSVNKVILIGNLGQDPEIRNMQSGDKVCSFSLATSESWKSKDGERQERTQWHIRCTGRSIKNVLITGNLADSGSAALRS